MSTDQFYYKVTIRVRFTADDLRLMKECADLHYDASCRTHFDQGKRGYGLRFCFSFPGTYEAADAFDPNLPADREIDAECNCEFRDLDRISKILSMGTQLEDPERRRQAFNLKTEVKRLMESLNKERERLVA